MPGRPLYILLASDTREKIQLAAMTASVAAVSDRATQILVTMGALQVFAAEESPEGRYGAGGMSALLAARKAPDPMELFQKGKMLGELKLLACPMALDILGWELSDLLPDLFDDVVGLTKFLSDAESGEMITI